MIKQKKELLPKFFNSGSFSILREDNITLIS